MSKSQKIKILLQNGLTPKDIEIITGFSYKYICNVVYDLKNPGVLLAANKRWRKSHRDKNSKHKRKLILVHQEITKPLAKNARQPWMVHEIEYLKTHGSTKTIKELALDLKRTYRAVQMAGHRFNIDLRGNKMGVNANRFRTLQAAE